MQINSEKSILVIGSLNMDMVIRANYWPKKGETIIGDSFNMFSGGKGANQAAAIALQGYKSSILGFIGEDTFGDRILDSLNGFGVYTKYVKKKPNSSTGLAFIVIDEKGQNQIIVISGANSLVSTDDIDSSIDLITQSDIVLLQLEIPIPAVVRAIEIANYHGKLVILNPAPFQTLPTHIYSKINYLIPNEIEAKMLFNLYGDLDLSMIRDGMNILGISNLIITIGEKGAILFDEADIVSVPGYSVPSIDMTAAGDAFVGGFTVALAEGKSLIEAVHWGNATGALATTVLGAQTSLPNYQSVKDLTEKLPEYL